VDIIDYMAVKAINLLKKGEFFKTCGRFIGLMGDMV